MEKFWDSEKGKARREIICAFANFDKWDTYGTAFDHMDAKRITLKEIQEIAKFVADIDSGVIAERRISWTKMYG